MTVITKTPEGDEIKIIPEVVQPILPTASVSHEFNSNNLAPQNSITSIPECTFIDEAGETNFPVKDLLALDEMIHRTRWVVPVLAHGELEILLNASIELSSKGLDIKSDACQRFYREGLIISFTKILTDEAVNGWKPDIQKAILKNCERLVELTTLKLDQDVFPLLEMLSLVFNPNIRFHNFNQSRSSEQQPPQGVTYAQKFDQRIPKEWLIDLINLFGRLNGFDILLERFKREMTITLMAMYLRPFGLCAEYLTPETLEKYFIPIINIVQTNLEGMKDEDLKRESKGESKNDALSLIVNSLKSIVLKLPDQEQRVTSIELLRLNILLRLLQVSSFNGKMNALNEVNRLISNVTYNINKHSPYDIDDSITSLKIADWIASNNVLAIVLRDNMHQPQFVEKLEKIIRFVIKEKALSLTDLDKIWEAQAGKHEAIVKNVHDLLTKLAWDFSPVQLDHLFECFQGSWVNATKKQREKLLELIRRLAEDDKEGVMAHKVLGLLWNLARSDDVSTDIMDQALAAHIKILDFSCSQVSSQDRDSQKINWISKCIEELEKDQFVLPALKHIREICQLFTESPQNMIHAQRPMQQFYRNKVINQLQNEFSIVDLIANSINKYMDQARSYAKEHPDEDPTMIFPDKRFNHNQQVNDRLKFLRFLLKDGHLWLCKPQATQIWKCLGENAIYPSDRENCFRWYSKLMCDEPDLDPEITNEFFQNYILKFDPSLLTEHGMICYERFFRYINMKQQKIQQRRKGGYVLDDVNLIGVEYLWRVISHGPEDVSDKAIFLLKDTYTNLGTALLTKQVEIHEDFLQDCMNRLLAMYDTISAIEHTDVNMPLIQQEAQRMIRILTVLRVYIADCDDMYAEERAFLPLYRAFRSKQVIFVIRFANQGRSFEDLELCSHGNETIAHLRRQIINRMKPNNSNLKVELFINGDLIDTSNDRKTNSQIGFHDRVSLTAKWVQVGVHNPSSPDSSSGSSNGSMHDLSGPNFEAESILPGVLMSTRLSFADHLFKLADLGCVLNVPILRDTARDILKLIPADCTCVERLKSLCNEGATHTDQPKATDSRLVSLFMANQSPSFVLYNLDIIYCLFFPANNIASEETTAFQTSFILSGGVGLGINIITNNSFMINYDLTTKRKIFLTVLKICKTILLMVGFGFVQSVGDSLQRKLTISQASQEQANIIQNFMQNLFSVDIILMRVASRIGSSLRNRLIGIMPTITFIRCLQKLAWTSAGECLQLVHSSCDEIQKILETNIANCALNVDKQIEEDDILTARECLEVLSISSVLCPETLDLICRELSWQQFIIDLLLVCRILHVRLAAVEQFFMMATTCTQNSRICIYFITLLFTVLEKKVKDYPSQSQEYFSLLCRLLNHACINNITLGAQVDALLTKEILWLKGARASVLKRGVNAVDECLLMGHLSITKELVLFQNSARKHQIGSEIGGHLLIKELVEDFLFTASKVHLQYQKNQGDIRNLDESSPVCTSPQTVLAAVELLASFVSGCLPNLKCLTDMLDAMFYSDNQAPLLEWEFMPHIGAKQLNGYVGLKNAGATCYMNSVIQQLFMTESIRDYILTAEGAADDTVDVDEYDERPDSEHSQIHENLAEDVTTIARDQEVSGKGIIIKMDERKEYNIKLLKYVQYMFAHLAYSKMQFYVPRGFWKHFRLQGEPVNLREQHDALEFFNSLVDSLDEALKALGYLPILTKVLGGSFADQKICKDCPHRYSREESFTVLNIDIRNHQNLMDSLEQYVKGDLLEGANAYYCEKCAKKVDTIKRLCIKKLPPILAIQLKRFDYDWERECAIKFNDYFEFPRQLDMMPYTAQGLSRAEGETIAEEDGERQQEFFEEQETKYNLVGMVVHSGQASGGHYYSFILHRSEGKATTWYKFDDGEVTEFKMSDDEEMKSHCFGGDYYGEVFDQMMKRMSYRKQKRWWNAYILFYERVVGLPQQSSDDKLSSKLSELSIGSEHVKMPPSIERCVKKHNINFLHNRNQFCPEYFRLMRRILFANVGFYQLQQPDEILTPEGEEYALVTLKIISKFLFNIGFHTKKVLRGAMNEWHDGLTSCLRHSKAARLWFTQNIILSRPSRLSEFLLESPNSEIRTVFMKLLVFVAHFTHKDGPCPVSFSSGVTNEVLVTLSDHILFAVLSLLKKEVPEHSRHLSQFFQLFCHYIGLGSSEKLQLIRLNVLELFMQATMDDTSSVPLIKYQYAEASKLYAVVAQLIRSCDVTHLTSSATPGRALLPNLHGEPKQPIIKLPTNAQELLFTQITYVKKVITDCNNFDETTKMLKYCCWENAKFSATVVSEILMQIAYSYTNELRLYLDLLQQILYLDDSYQTYRIINALKGITDNRDGLFGTIESSQNQYQKRAYQCIKMLVFLLKKCLVAFDVVMLNHELKKKKVPTATLR